MCIARNVNAKYIFLPTFGSLNLQNNIYSTDMKDQRLQSKCVCNFFHGFLHHILMKNVLVSFISQMFAKLVFWWFELYDELFRVIIVGCIPKDGQESKKLPSLESISAALRYSPADISHIWESVRFLQRIAVKLTKFYVPLKFTYLWFVYSNSTGI